MSKKLMQLKRLFLGIIPAGLLLPWGWNFYKNQEIKEYASERRELGAEAYFSDESPEVVYPSVRNFSDAASFYADEYFPSDHERGVGLLNEAINLRPLRADLWMNLSRHQLFSGSEEEAVASLETANDLHPSNPVPRQQGIQILGLLDRDEDAEKLALQLSELDSQGRAEAARALRQIGYSPLEIFEKLNLNQLEPDYLAGVLASASSSSVDHRRDLLEAVSNDLLSEVSIKREFVKLASIEPIVYDQLFRIWRVNSQEMVPISSVSGMYIDNPDLLKNPLDNDFSLGWQELQERAWSDTRWYEETEESLETDVRGIYNLYVYADNLENRSNFSWPIYVLPVPPKTGPIEISLRLMVAPHTSTSCLMTVRANGRWENSRPVTWEDRRWKDLSMVVDPRDEGEVIEIRLRRVSNKAMYEDRINIWVDSIQVRSSDRGEDK